MSSLGKAVSFIATSNLNESRRFYEKVLGFCCLSEDPYALVFDLGGSTLRIQKVESVPEVNYTVLGWEVADIRSSVDGLSKKGLQFEGYPQLDQDDLGIWSSPSGAKVAWFSDPDGNVLSLTEMPKP